MSTHKIRRGLKKMSCLLFAKRAYNGIYIMENNIGEKIFEFNLKNGSYEFYYYNNSGKLLSYEIGYNNKPNLLREYIYYKDCNTLKIEKDTDYLLNKVCRTYYNKAGEYLDSVDTKLIKIFKIFYIEKENKTWQYL